MRIGIKPGQIGLEARELPEYWRVAEELGFESVWTFDHLTGRQTCFEAVTLLAAMAVVTKRVRIGCLVLAHGTRNIGSLAAQLATVDALSGGRLEVGLGMSSSFAKLDFDALGLPFGSFLSRSVSYRKSLDRLHELLSERSPLAAHPAQATIPMILGGTSGVVRDLAREKLLAWNYSGGSEASPKEFARLAEGQIDAQAQVFLNSSPDLAETVAGYKAAGCSRLVVVLSPPMSLNDLERVAKLAGL